MKKTITLTEKEIKEAVMDVINEMPEPVSPKKRQNPIEKIQAAIDAANKAYNDALEQQGGGDWPLMDRKGESYGLTGQIRLDGKGYVIIPMDSGKYGEYGPVKIRVLSKAGGKIRLINGDYFTEGWRDVAKILKQIVRDAEIGNGHSANFDPAWEEGGPENKAALRAMNKQIGRNANAGMEYLESIIRESVTKILKEGGYYDPVTYKRDESKEFNIEEIKQLVAELSANPIEDMWKPQNIGLCNVQRVEANQTGGGKIHMLNDGVGYCDGNNGEIFIQIGREPNTNWFEDSGQTYMCWK